SHVAPALQGKEAELKRSQLEDMLNTKIQERPSAEVLVEKHILDKGNMAAPGSFGDAIPDF
ncbi:hypothetical protein BGZ79_004558, partial [Entomortierella chlamydospora]